MAFIQQKRKLHRLQSHDYSGADYFVTVCTKNKEHHFGAIKGDDMKLSALGVFLLRNLQDLKTHFDDVEVVKSVVMPNHFHAIISVTAVGSRPVATADRPQSSNQGKLNQLARLAVATGRDPMLFT
ncbi:transposase [uncultured Muribaculum sp.]|uniref:transposase n=1 Tax=uncultured Muribaculum sp. TaxID=1918613 RepID=UPI0026DF6EBA|nr:transposase [uncultured Muribaculum sp.]